MGVVTNSYRATRSIAPTSCVATRCSTPCESRRQAALQTRVSLVCIWSDVPSCGALAFWSPEFHGWAESTSGLVV